MSRRSPAFMSHVYDVMDIGASFLEAVKHVAAEWPRIRSDDQAKRVERRRREAQVKAWNIAYPPGTRVALRVVIHDPETETTRTRSTAYEQSGTAMVMVEGRAGGYGLDWLRPLADGERGPGEAP